jgi:hypothetical protein
LTGAIGEKGKQIVQVILRQFQNASIRLIALQMHIDRIQSTYYNISV